MTEHLDKAKRSCNNQASQNIIDTGELIEDSVGSILEHTADDGKVYATKYYNLDAIIARGENRGGRAQ